MNDIVVVGPGGIGGPVAALLARAGHASVTVLGRPGAHIDAIRDRGLRLTGRADFTATVAAVDDARDLTGCDVLICTVKARDTEAVLEATAHIEVRDFAVSLQNGTTKDDQLARVFGRTTVIGAVPNVGGERRHPGKVRWTYGGPTLFGELDGSSSARVDSIVELFAGAGMTAGATDTIVSATWSKMAGWIATGLFASLGCMTNAEVFTDPLVARECVGLVREVGALAEAQGIALQDLGPFRVASWNQVALAEAVELAMASPLAASDSRHSASQDIARGQRTEFRECLGPMLEDAEKLAVPMPGVRSLYAALLALERSL